MEKLVVKIFNFAHKKCICFKDIIFGKPVFEFGRISHKRNVGDVKNFLCYIWSNLEIGLHFSAWKFENLCLFFFFLSTDSSGFLWDGCGKSERHPLDCNTDNEQGDVKQAHNCSAKSHYKPGYESRRSFLIPGWNIPSKHFADLSLVEFNLEKYGSLWISVCVCVDWFCMAMFSCIWFCLQVVVYSLWKTEEHLGRSSSGRYALVHKIKKQLNLLLCKSADDTVQINGYLGVPQFSFFFFFFTFPLNLPLSLSLSPSLSPYIYVCVCVCLCVCA